MKRIGIYGGSFDPVHVGHLRSAVEVRQRFQLDQVRLLPSGNPPHRDGAQVDAAHRLAMLEVAIEGVDGLHVDAREIKSTAVSYSIDTIEELQREYPRSQLVLVIGMDQFVAFETWHRWRDILQQAELVVMERPGEKLDRQARQRLRHGDAKGIELCRVTQFEISSSRIRRDLRQKLEIHFLVPYAVHRYIVTNALYGDLTD